MNPAWWIRLCDAVHGAGARLFRRTPPHLRGRVPVDGRVSSVVRCTLTGEPDGACSAHRFCPVVRPDSQWTPPPDEKGRAFLRSVPPLPRPEEVDSITREALWGERRTKPVARAMDQHLQHHPEEAEPQRYVRRELGNGWVTHTLERPKPAENARRYSEEDGTW